MKKQYTVSIDEKRVFSTDFLNVAIEDMQYRADKVSIHTTLYLDVWEQYTHEPECTLFTYTKADGIKATKNLESVIENHFNMKKG